MVGLIGNGFVVTREAMRILKSNRSIIRVLIVLAVAQIIGWGTVGLPAVVGREIAADLHMSIAVVFAGTSVLYTTMGLWSPVLARAFTRFGARLVMILGSVVAAPGFALLAVADGPVAYFAGWVFLGTAGGATLSTAANILLNEVAGKDARSAIGALMLVTGLSSSIFWPATALLSLEIGWRATCLVYSAAMIFICLPLYVFGLPGRATPEAKGRLPNATAAPIARTGTFHLIVWAIALNAFITFGFSAVLIELLKTEGLAPSQAIAFASVLGVIQVSARGFDFLGGGRWDGITTGLVAGAALPIAMLFLMTGKGAHWSITAFILLYGLGSGALAVARATIPLVFHEKADYAKAASHIALPLNLISALSPPVMAALLFHSGPTAVLSLAILCSCLALAIMLVLSRRRPQVGTAAVV